jgi:3-dehydroquinate dehydratase-1
MSMGPLGAVGRFGGHFGSDLTFAVGLEASAPGQMDLDLVRRVLVALGLRAPAGEP